MNIDEMKQLAKNEKKLETLKQAVRIYSQNLGMGFGIENCVMLKQETKNGGKNRTTKSRQSQKAWKKNQL